VRARCARAPPSLQFVSGVTDGWTTAGVPGTSTGVVGNRAERRTRCPDPRHAGFRLAGPLGMGGKSRFFTPRIYTNSFMFIHIHM
jgi:hypothetical protein